MQAKVKVTTDRVKGVAASLRSLSERRVMVGVPAEKALRDDEDPERDVNNAFLAYVHEHGAPEVNLPARPFLRPGIKAVQGEISKRLRDIGLASLDGSPQKILRMLNALGLFAQAAVRRKITTGPFVPLSARTIAQRRIRSKGSKYRRKATTAADVKPLIDTGQLRNAINYVIRRRK